MESGVKISDRQFKQLSDIVYKETGIVLDGKKYNLLVARLSKRMRKTNTRTVSDYIQLVSDSETEFSNFIDATTTNHTFFFRENKHCEFILKTMDNSKPLKIWCAASSSGEEPFSIAFQLLDHSFSFSIFASDVSDTMLDHCRKAVYSKEKVKNVSRSILHRYFQKGKGKWQDFVRVRSEVMQHVTFGKFNLLHDTPSEEYDIIFCRNVMIYFDIPTRQQVVNTLARAVKPGGYFFVGMSESLHGLDHKLINVLSSGYQKK